MSAWPWPDYTAEHHPEYDDPGPAVSELESDVLRGKRCVECQCAFKRAQPKSTPNRNKTLCKECTRLFVESRGYNVGPERDAVNEGHAAQARKRRASKESR